MSPDRYHASIAAILGTLLCLLAPGLVQSAQPEPVTPVAKRTAAPSTALPPEPPAMVNVAAQPPAGTV